MAAPDGVIGGVMAGERRSGGGGFCPCAESGDSICALVGSTSSPCDESVVVCISFAAPLSAGFCSGEACGGKDGMSIVC